MDSSASIQRFRQQLAALRTSGADVAAGARALRTEGDALCAPLPPRFADVLHDLLARLESGALFDEESCSFSRAGLLDNLQLWADKAEQRLQAPAAG